ncbi:MAG: helix-turn-helix domain-containing protein [Deltaproteobacteria bacterium]|nr:helix-turn-helix domain-containing protein [Deltaproteobacteria bacterium]MBW2395549.1 helix-turn-helix domain-containing protein [Deltaproteobacteria bacterium]
MSRRALSATRATDLLSFLAAHPDRGFSYSELAKRLQVNLSSMHSILVALTESGFLSRHPNDSTYVLGPVLVAIGDAALDRNPMIDEARSRMRTLSRRLGLETLAFVRAGGDTLCVARAGPQPRPGMVVRVGQRVPLMAPLASAWVAWAPESEVTRWLTAGGAPRREERRLRKILETVRERGYSVAMEVEGRRRIGRLLAEIVEDPHSRTLRREFYGLIAELGHGPYQLAKGHAHSILISSITAPVFDAMGQVALSITLQGFQENLSSRAIREVGDRLLELTESIARVTR